MSQHLLTLNVITVAGAYGAVSTCLASDSLPEPILVGAGHSSTIHACTVEDNSLVGMKSTLLDGVTVSLWHIITCLMTHINSMVLHACMHALTRAHDMCLTHCFKSGQYAKEIMLLQNTVEVAMLVLNWYIMLSGNVTAIG